MASGGALGTINRGCIYRFLYQRTPQGRGVFLFIASVLVPESLANFSENSKFLQTAPSHCLTASLTEYGGDQTITFNGNKRSALNYSFGMSNNACRLLFRVGETHWIIQGEGFSFLRKGGTMVQMFVRVLSGCRSPLSFLSWPWLSLQRRHGWHRMWQGLVFLPFLQASSTQRGWVGKTTGSWLLLV